MTKILLTGGAGFIGHHLAKTILDSTDWNLIIIDKLTYASYGFDRLREEGILENPRVTIFTYDFSQPISSGMANEIGQVDYIIHMGAETFVEKSIEDPLPFVQSNVIGSSRLLEFAKTQTALKHFIYTSTDEIFGSALQGQQFKEWDRYNSSNPYAATKAAGEEMALAFANTYGIPVLITHTMNVFGERQHPEKFIPKAIRHILDNKVLSIHADKTRTMPGSRFYTYARNFSHALLFLLQKAECEVQIEGEEINWKRDKFNITGEREIDNLELTQIIGRIMGKEPKYELVDFHSSRPGHDLRYALDNSRILSLGWRPKFGLEESLESTIRWTLDNPKWLYGI